MSGRAPEAVAPELVAGDVIETSPAHPLADVCRPERGRSPRQDRPLERAVAAAARLAGRPKPRSRGTGVRDRPSCIPLKGGMTELDGDRPMKTIGMSAYANGTWERRSGNRVATCRQDQHCEGPIESHERRRTRAGSGQASKAATESLEDGPLPVSWLVERGAAMPAMVIEASASHRQQP